VNSPGHKQQTSRNELLATKAATIRSMLCTNLRQGSSKVLKDFQNLFSRSCLTATYAEVLRRESGFTETKPTPMIWSYPRSQEKFLFVHVVLLDTNIREHVMVHMLLQRVDRQIRHCPASCAAK